MCAPLSPTCPCLFYNRFRVGRQINLYLFTVWSRSYISLFNLVYLSKTLRLISAHFARQIVSPPSHTVAAKIVRLSLFASLEFRWGDLRFKNFDISGICICGVRCLQSSSVWNVISSDYFENLLRLAVVNFWTACGGCSLCVGEVIASRWALINPDAKRPISSPVPAKWLNN